MGKSGGLSYRILIWTYERGTLPYDIICALILAFVFIVPRSCFVQKTEKTAAAPAQETRTPTEGMGSRDGASNNKK